jgi:hypothetical protein
MISGIDLAATVDYTLKDDVEPKTIWKLGIIPSYLMAKVSAEAANNEIETTFRLLQLCIKGWENFNIPYETTVEKIYGRELNVVPIAVLEKLPINVISELSLKVLELNKLTKEERKN